MTQADLDAGGFDLAATVSGDWTGLPAEATDAERVPLVRSAGWPGGTTDSNPVTVTWTSSEVDDADDDGLAATGFAGQGLGLTGLGAIGFGALLWAFGARRRRRS